MSNLKSNDPLCRRIVSAFLSFLRSVEPAQDVDFEGVEVATECLEDVFKINTSSIHDNSVSSLLVNFFRSLDDTEQGFTLEMGPGDDGTVDASRSVIDKNQPIASSSQTSGPDDFPSISGDSKDELFRDFCCALEKINFFRPTASGEDDPIQLAKASSLFENALLEMERCGWQTNKSSLADALKVQGNDAMQSKLYNEAVKLYTYALTLQENNAVYYCNRAAAYTQLFKYKEAIEDCIRSIEINPSYSKAYSRLGLAYYAQGNYRDAINKGFLKALQLDPNNNSIRENILAAEQKMKEEQQRERNQNTTSRQNQGQPSGSSNPGVPFTSMPFDRALHPDIANMIMNMASTASSSQHAPNINGVQTDLADGINEPSVRLDNISVALGEYVPQELSSAWQSVMGMFPPNQGQ